ncbi:nucleoside phosphorylase domain-containing protein [Aspergillus carlsbadensis]|nr:nucleoside phosphorylase domain-containing protein [Aspergillus carlsbadensis]
MNFKTYIVGWICASTTEYVAAKAFLDDDYGSPKTVSPIDNNNHTLGRVGNHNIVIALVPDSERGLSEVACGARDMLHSFPNIKIGLSVGIAHGAPNAEYDIRLGDVVVASPGVAQYDRGGYVDDEDFQQWSPLNRPPMHLETAVGALEAKYMLRKNTIYADIESILIQHPLMKRDFARPPLETDKLFKSDITHDSWCLDNCLIGSIHHVPRRDKSSWREDPKRNDPVVHHGIVATGSTVMEDATTRDELSGEKGFLCFDTVASALIDNFPCVVIRGIADYADTHKNGKWKRYAAMTAAACAKDLLSLVPPFRIEPEINLTKVLDWLAPDDYTWQHNDYIDHREPGTGQWFLDSPEFKAWTEERGKILFCPGMPGAGMSIMASAVVDHLQDAYGEDPNIGLAYIYFDDYYVEPEKRSTRDAETAYLIPSRTYIPPEDGRIGRQLKLSHECAIANGCREQLLSWILNSQFEHGINFLVTSRAIPRFKDSAIREILATSDDIRAYIHSRIARSGVPLLHTNRERITDEITKMAKGMFLLAEYHYDTISTRKTTRALNDTLFLRTEPKAYDDLYDIALNAFLTTRSVSINIACEPLTLPDMQYALAVMVDELTFDQDNVLHPDDLVSACRGWVTCPDGINLQFAPPMMKEYLQWSRDISFRDAERAMAECCRAFLAYENIGGEGHVAMQGVPFRDYAVRYCEEHGRAADEEARNREVWGEAPRRALTGSSDSSNGSFELVA